MKENDVIGCAAAISVFDEFANKWDSPFWLFFKDKEAAKIHTLNEVFWRDYECPDKISFNDVVVNCDGVPVACESFWASEEYFYKNLDWYAEALVRVGE